MSDEHEDATGRDTPEAPVPLNNRELQFLSVLLEANYHFLTIDERKARQALRNKIKDAATSLG